MKNKFLLLCLLFISYGTIGFSQQGVYRTSESFVYGEFEDSLFEGVYQNVIIKMNTNTSEIKIVAFNDEIKTTNSKVDSIFKSLKGSIYIELSIDPRSYEDKENVLDNEVFQGNALVTYNGIILNLPCEYTIHILKTNNTVLKEMKLTLNILLPLEDFDIDPTLGFSEEIELEIGHGVINQ